VHRGGRSLEGRSIGTSASSQSVAQDPIDQADCRERRSRERNAASVRGSAPPPPPPQPAADGHDDDDASTSTAAPSCPDRDRGRWICATRLGRGRPV